MTAKPLVEGHRRRPFAENLPAVFGLADERAGAALGGQPFDVIQILTIALGKAEQQIVELPESVRGLAVDRFWCAVFGDHIHRSLTRVRVEQQGVNRVQPFGGDAQLLRGDRSS